MSSIIQQQGYSRLLAIICFSLILQAYSSVTHAETTMSSANEMIAEMLKTAVDLTPEAEKPPIKELYLLSSHTLIWLNNNQQVESALKLLADSNSHGLRLDDYDVEGLNVKWQQLSRSLSPSFQQLVDLDVSLSQNLLTYLSDLQHGRINPKKVSFGFEINKQPLKLARETFAAIEKNNLTTFAQQQEPQFIFYQNLKQGLNKYQKLAQKYPDLVFKFPKKLKLGAKHQQIALLRKLLMGLGDFIEIKSPDEFIEGVDDVVFDKALVIAIKSFQRRHALKVSGKLDKKTIKALNTPLSNRIEQIKLGLERLRWMPKYAEDRLVFVNIPSFQLWAFDELSDKKKEPLNMRVVVGKSKKHQTPIFSAKMQYLAFRPYWNIPQSIIKNEIMPKLRKNPNYLAQKNMERVSSGKFTSIRQRPGVRNALGLVKFIFPNRHSVYLHDTPSKRLFKRTRRDFSHGCIRVSEPITLAEFALGKQSSNWSEAKVKRAMQKGNDRRVSLEAKIPVVIFYSTVMATEDGIYFLNDIYDYDSKLKRKLLAHKKHAS